MSACTCVLVTCGCGSCHKDQPPCDQRLGDEPGGRKTTALGQSSVSTTTPGRCHTSSARCSRTIRLYPLPLSVFLYVLVFLFSARLFGEHDVLCYCVYVNDVSLNTADDEQRGAGILQVSVRGVVD